MPCVSLLLTQDMRHWPRTPTALDPATRTLYFGTLTGLAAVDLAACAQRRACVVEQQVRSGGPRGRGAAVGLRVKCGVGVAGRPNRCAQSGGGGCQ